MTQPVPNAATNEATTITTQVRHPNDSLESLNNITQPHFPNLTQIPQSIINRATKMGNFGIPYSSVQQIGKVIQNLGSSSTHYTLPQSPKGKNKPTPLKHPPSPDSDMSVQVFPRAYKRRTINDSDDNSDHTPNPRDIRDSIDDINLSTETHYHTTPPVELLSPNVSIILSDGAPDITHDSITDLMDGPSIDCPEDLTHDTITELMDGPSTDCPDDTEMSSGQSG